MILKNLVNLSELYNDVLLLQYQTKSGRFAKKIYELFVVVSKDLFIVLGAPKDEKSLA